jgi:hypothetical protein
MIQDFAEPRMMRLCTCDALQLLPNIQAEIFPGASHALREEKSEIVNARILQFCRGNRVVDEVPHGPSNYSHG